MTQRFKYKLYLFALCLTSALSLKAQYSEDKLLSEANVLFEQHKYAEAMPLYAQLLSLEPTKPEFNFKYGATALYGDASKKEEAIKYLRFASSKNGVDNSCWYFLGKAYHLNYQFADAIRAYQKFKELASKKEIAELNVDREIADCRNGQNLLSNIKEVTVLAKNKSLADSFFRIYDLSDIGGKILVTPDALLSSLDKKKNHRSLILFRGSGTTVYFSSYGKDGENGLDIYQAEVLPNGAFSTPQKLGPEINTPYDEDYPFLHPDNKTFYFSSKGHSSMGGYDIFRASLDASTGTFTKAENLDFAINTPDDDLFYVADSAKKMANFASSRSSKQGELDVYKVLVKSAPAEITLIKGSFSNEIDPENKLAKITVVDASNNAQIDVQYTDPGSGDYVLSFPRSGKFKFLVEVEKSNQVHSGIVEIPKSSGIKAYLQKMQLVSSAGVEKLLINNLFDQTFDGDVTALAQRLLRQRAALDVNFNASEETEQPALPDTSQDIAMAYNAAGFGAGLSNEKVLNAAQERTQEIASKAEEIKQLKSAAMLKYQDVLAVAQARHEEASKLIAQANELTGDERSRIMFDAGLAKLKAENALHEAENSKALVDNLSKIGERAKSALTNSQQFDDSLQAALEGEDYNAALILLKREKIIEEGTDKSDEVYNPVSEMQSTSIDAQKDAKKYLDRASSLRAQTNDLQTHLITKNRQRETAKGKDAAKLDGEIANLKSEIANSERRTDKAFAEAEKLQKEAFDKSQQYEILTALYETTGDEGNGESVSDNTNAINEADLDQIALSISKLSVDNESVSSYLKAHPEAGDSFKNDRMAMVFKKEYAPTSPDNSEAIAQNTDDLLAESTEIDKTQIEDSVKSISTDNSESGKDESASDSQPNKNEKGNDDAASTNATATEAPNLLTKSSEDTSVTENFVDQVASENDSTDKSTPSSTAPGKESKGDLTDENNSDAVGVNDEDAKATVSISVSPDENQPNPEEISKQIDAERVKITASQDWIAIIDASIAELEDDIAANTTTDKEDAQAQLDQYKSLRIAKENEITSSKALINKLEEAKRTNSKDEEEALAVAENDVDTLSASLVSRLEMKSNDSATDIQSIKNIRKIDASYLPELASIELSGLSDPEIAAKRIALNKTFIATVVQKMADNSNTELSAEKLLEMRRMKMLEIRQDREVQMGEMAYQARTPEAREYKSMISDTLTANVQNTELPNSSMDFSNMSPELAREIQIPYSRDIILPGYQEEMAQSEQLANDSAKAAARVDINQNYLKNLQADIQIYSAAIQGTTNADNKIALQNRYDKLLAERSAVIDEMDADKAIVNTVAPAADLNDMAMSEADKHASPEIENTQSPKDTLDLAEQTDNQPDNLLEIKTDLINHYDSLYKSSSDEILAETPSKADQLNELARTQCFYGYTN